MSSLPSSVTLPRTASTAAAPGAALPPVAGLPADGLAVLDDPVEQRRFTRYLAAGTAGAAEQAESALRISGMHCAACAGTIEAALAQVDGVVEATVSAAGERARVRWQPGRTTVADIVRSIRAAGYDAAPDVAMAARDLRRQEWRAALWRLFVAGFCGMQVMMMATPSYVASGDDLAPDLRQLLNWGSWLLTLPVMAFSAGPFFTGAWRSLRQRRIGMDVPVALGIAVTFVASTGATFDPSGVFGHEVYFDSLTMFVSFLLGGRLLETRARHRVAQVLESALSGMPETAQRVGADGHPETVSVQRLLAGDRVRVAVGQAFPADGAVVAGDTRADESLLTGESTPVPKPCGAPVVAGSLNMGAPVEMVVQRVGEDTRLASIVALMQQAMTQRPAWARVADRWAPPFLWTVLVLAAGAAAVWSVIDPSRAVWVAVAVLIVTCPCALSLAAPSALLAAASALARRGVLLQRLDALEAFTRVQRVYLDKTGTVTDEQLSCDELRRLPGAVDLDRRFAEDDALLAQAAGLAAWSAHPVSRAIVAAAQKQGVAVASSGWTAVRELAGQGIEALDTDGRRWRLGRAGWAGQWPDGAAVGADAAAGAVDPAAPRLACDGVAVAAFTLGESLRPDAAEAVAQLRAAGLEVVLLSGDQLERAERMGARLQVDRTLGSATPETKLAEVAAAQAAGQVVAMVGDGINDAPVLARADVSLAMGQGALVARAQADAVIASNRLTDVVAARVIAQRAMAIVRQNFAWAAGYNAICIPLAMVGWLPPWAAGLGMALSSLLVIGNAARLAR